MPCDRTFGDRGDGTCGDDRRRSAQLPLVLSAAQWLEEQALADGCFGLALGLPLHLGLPPFVTGSGAAVKILTEDMKELTGGQVIINPDAKESADILEKIILEKRDALHI